MNTTDQKNSMIKGNKDPRNQNPNTNDRNTLMNEELYDIDDMKESDDSNKEIAERGYTVRNGHNPNKPNPDQLTDDEEDLNDDFHDEKDLKHDSDDLYEEELDQNGKNVDDVNDELDNPSDILELEDDFNETEEDLDDIDQDDDEEEYIEDDVQEEDKK